MAEIKISYIHFFKNPYKVGNRDKYSKMEVWIKTHRENTASWGEGGGGEERVWEHIFRFYILDPNETIHHTRDLQEASKEGEGESQERGEGEGGGAVA